MGVFSLFGGQEEEKTATGGVSNVVTVGEPISLNEKELFIMITIICVIKILELMYMTYKINARRIKKKMNDRQLMMSNLNLNRLGNFNQNKNSVV